jgi:hypothetical protein
MLGCPLAFVTINLLASFRIITSILTAIDGFVFHTDINFFGLYVFGSYGSMKSGTVNSCASEVIARPSLGLLPITSTYLLFKLRASVWVCLPIDVEFSGIRQVDLDILGDLIFAELDVVDDSIPSLVQVAQHSDAIALRKSRRQFKERL